MLVDIKPVLMGALITAALVSSGGYCESIKAQTAALPKSMAWTAMRGRAIDISIGGDGAIFTLDTDGLVWLRRPVEAVSASGASNLTETNSQHYNWIHLPGKFVRISAANERLAWTIDPDGVLYQYAGTWWKPMNVVFPIQATDVGVGATGVAYAITRSGSLVGLDPLRGVVDLSILPDAPSGLERVDVDDQGRAWCIAHNGSVHRFNGQRWQSFPDIKAKNIAVAGSGIGGLWFVDLSGELNHMQTEASPPEKLAVKVEGIATAPNGKPWITTSDGTLYANDVATVVRGRKTTASTPQVFSQLLNWQRVTGLAKQLAISSKGAIVTLGLNGEVWFWKGRNNWGRLPGKLDRVAIDTAGTVWGLDAEGKVLRYQGNYWQKMSGTARLIAAGADGSIWIVGKDEQLKRWDGRVWADYAAPAMHKIKQLAIAPEGSPWILAEDGGVRHFDGKKWLDIPEIAAVELSVGPEGTVFTVDAEKHLWRWDAVGKRWDRLNGEAVSIAAGPRGVPWITRSGGEIFAAGFFDELLESKVASVSTATENAVRAGSGGGYTPIWSMASGGASVGAGDQVPTGKPDEPLVFQKLSGAPRELAIGADGSVFGVNFDGTLIRWSNGRNTFVSFPGQLARIAVMPDGSPWGITLKGEVFRHDGSVWRVINNIAASDIAIGFNGTVIAIGPQSILHRYNPVSGLFDRLYGPDENSPPPAGVRVAVDPKGAPWVIQSDGYVARCEKLVCTRIAVRANDIDIGPDGSIFIVDISKVLRRWNTKTQNFDRVNTVADPIERVAVGPYGKPWLINSNFDPWSSAFFQRDESRDITTSATSTANTTTAPTPVFTFSSNMIFDEIPWAGGAMYPVGLAAGPGGKVYALHLTSALPMHKVLAYDPVGKRFIDSTIPPQPNSNDNVLGKGLALGSGDELWSWFSPDGFFDGHVWKLVGNAWQEVTGLSDMALGGVMRPMDIAIGPDGRVMAASPTASNSVLYRYNVVSKQFAIDSVQFSGNEDALTIDGTNSTWIVRNDNKVYQYVNNGFVERALPAGMSLCPAGNVHSRCISAGANGAVFAVASETPSSSTKLLRWNAASGQWDKIINSPNFGDIYMVVVAADGRPWVIDRSTNKIYRAR